MALNYIWLGFFIISFVVATCKLIFFQDTGVFMEMVNTIFDSAKTGFTISIGLTGVLAFWLGLMKVGEEGGVVTLLSRIINPFFRRIFPDLRNDSPAFASMVMNFASNMLGLDNAATPLGLKAMQQMQEDNPDKNKASNPMIMFLVLNTSGFTLIPISVLIYRIEAGAANATDIFLPILLATFFATLSGFLAVCIKQRINIFDRYILGVLVGLISLVSFFMWRLSLLSREDMETVSLLISGFLIFTIIIVFLVLGMVKKVNVYEAFIVGAKDGFQVAVKIIPYLIAILVAIGVFRASGALLYLTDGIGYIFSYMALNTEFVEALPTAFMKPLSGSGARGMMLDAMNTYGPDSFVGRMSCIFQGATDTTFYVLAVYFGSVGIKNTRYALSYGLFADFIGIVASILICYFFFA